MDLDFKIAVAVSVAFCILYVVVGGIYSVTWTDMAELILVVFGLVIKTNVYSILSVLIWTSLFLEGPYLEHIALFGYILYSIVQNCFYSTAYCPVLYKAASIVQPIAIQNCFYSTAYFLYKTASTLQPIVQYCTKLLLQYSLLLYKTASTVQPTVRYCTKLLLFYSLLYSTVQNFF